MGGKLDFRYDIPMERIGKEIEAIKPGEIKFKWEDELIPIITLSNAILDVFEIPGGYINTLYLKDQNTLDTVKDFMGINSGDWEFYVAPNRMKNVKNIHILKYQFGDQVIDIKVFCPIKYNEYHYYRVQWFERLKLIQNGRRKRNN